MDIIIHKCKSLAFIIGGVKMVSSKIKVLIVIMLSLTLILTGCGNKVREGDITDSLSELQEVEKIKVFASFYPFYDFVSKVGGDRVEVNVVVPPATEPHSFEPTPRVLAEIEKADIFIYNGLEFEPWVEGVLELLKGKNTVVINASNGLDLIEFGEDDDHDHEEGEDDHHGEYDPHIWLDPNNVIIISENIKNALMGISEADSELFEANYLSFKEKLDSLNADFIKGLENIKEKDRKIIVSHSAFAYLARRYNIKEIAVAGASPHAEPTPAKLAELTKLAKKYNIKYIFFEVLANPKTAEVLSKEANLEPLVLYNIEGLSKEQLDEGEDYMSLMYKNLESLKKALVR